MNCLSSGINILAGGSSVALNAKAPTRIGSICIAHTSPHSAAPWRHCVTSLRSPHWLASSLKLAARCPVSGCLPSCSRPTRT